MGWITESWKRLGSLGRRDAFESGLDEEIRFHVEQQTEKDLRAGMGPEEARRHALLKFGGFERAKEATRDEVRPALLEDSLRDLRHGCRVLWQARGFTAVAVLTLALGIGATTAIFSVVSGVILRPLPFTNPEQLVNIRETESREYGSIVPVSSGNFVDWKDGVPAFEAIAAWRFEYFNVAGRDEPEQVQGLSVSASYFPLLGVRTARGRLFLPEDERVGHEGVAILADALWRRRFSSAIDLVGQSINIDGRAFIVIGILPSSFNAGRILNRPVDLYVPLITDTAQQPRRGHDLNVYGRLKASTTLEQAQAQLNQRYQELAKAYPATNTDLQVRVFSMPEAFRRSSRPVLRLLMAAVATVLLIACGNISNLLLARTAMRQKEIALRAALGADRSRLVRQLLTESVLLALLGGTAGIIVAVWGVRLLNRIVPYSVIGRMEDFALDGRALVFSFAVSIMCGIVFGFVSARQSAGRTLNELLQCEGHGAAMTGPSARYAGRLFIVAQLTMAVMLSSGALLLMRSALMLQGLPRGLNLHNVLTVQISLPRSKYSDGRHIAQFFPDVLERLEKLPNVKSASAINFPPLAPQDTGVDVRIEGHAPTSPVEQLHARYSVIDPQYFRTMQIPVLSGRAFTDSDADELRGVAIVSATMARRFWPNVNPIGRWIQPQFKGPRHFWDAEFNNLRLTIVGMVGDIRDDGPALQGRDDIPLFYLPYRQNPAPLMHLLIRTRSNPLDVIPAVRRAVWGVDPNQPVFDAKSMEDLVAETFGQPRVMANFMATFASSALLLAALGVYGLLSYAVNRRMRDIGIQMALGARPQDILQAILREGAYLGAVGVVIGLAGSFASTRLLAGFLFGVGATDPLTLTSVACLMISVTLAACYFPARRAVKVDPVVALHCE